MTDEKFYTESVWHEIQRFSCDLCRYDTLNGEVLMVLHMASVHFPSPGAPPPPTLATVTRFGKVVEPPEDGAEAVMVLNTEEELLEAGYDLSVLSAEDVMELLETGKVDVELLIEAEESGRARKGLLKKLEAKE